MDTKLQKEAWECDYCGDLRLREEVNRVHNHVLWEKDVLIFCNDRPCQERYEHQDDTHTCCHHCKEIINVTLQTHVVLLDHTYHNACYRKHIKKSKELNNPPTWC